jgi:hypothetical protein
MATSAERMRVLRERRRRGLCRLRIRVCEDDLRQIAQAGYEGAASCDHDQHAQATSLFIHRHARNPAKSTRLTRGLFNNDGAKKDRRRVTAVLQQVPMMLSKPLLVRRDSRGEHRCEGCLQASNRHPPKI